MQQSREYGADPTRMFIGGNSAGAQMAAQLGSMVSDPQLAAQVGVTIDLPAEDLRGVVLYSGPYYFDTIARDDFPAFRTYAWAYTGEKDFEDYARLDELSPAKNVTSSYPPVYVTSGDADPLEPQTYEFDAVLRAQGVDVTSRYWTGSGLDLPHDYIYQLQTEQAQVAFQVTVTFMADHS